MKRISAQCLLRQVVLREFIAHVILEGKVDLLKQQNPKLSNEIDRLAQSDPSKTLKYINWAVKQLKMGAKMEDLVPTISIFHRKIDKFKNRDINKYKTLKELEDETRKISVTKTRKEIKAKGAEKLFENDRFILLYINSMDACSIYAANTKWCIVSDIGEFYGRQEQQNMVFYFIIDKKLESEDQMKKIALSIHRDEDNNVLKIDINNAVDTRLSALSTEYTQLLNIAKSDATKRPTGALVGVEEGKRTQDELIQAAMRIDDSYYVYDLLDCIDDSNLEKLTNAKSFSARAVAADHVDARVLPQMMDDEVNVVRRHVARRIDVEHLPQMMNDEDEQVQNIAKERLAKESA